MAKITYEDKEFLNKSENIADKNKVNDTDLNEIKNTVNQNDTNVGDLSDLNTIDKSSIVNSINEINNKGIYSTTEQAVGTWIDGKTVYRKVIDLGALNIQSGNITIPSTPTDVIVNGWFIMKQNDSYYLQYTGISILRKINDTTLYMVAGESFVCQQMYIVLEYTKPE